MAIQDEDQSRRKDLDWTPSKKVKLSSGDDLTKVNLLGANLNGANLTGAIITPKQLKQIASMQGAIMPDGVKHP